MLSSGPGLKFQPVFIQYIEIIRINAAVCFHCILDIAYTALITGFRAVAHEDANIIFKLADIRLAALLPVFVPEMNKVIRKLLYCSGERGIGILSVLFI